jgi:excisionase family DNA binding protein
MSKNKIFTRDVRQKRQKQKGLDFKKGQNDKQSWLFDNLIDRKKLAQELRVSESFISKLKAQEGLPSIKIGRLVRYRLDEVESWLNERRSYD